MNMLGNRTLLVTLSGSWGQSVLAWMLLTGTVHAAPTGLLNDTGQTQCDNGSNVLAACSIANAGNAATYPGQDGRFGRDVALPAKTGGGAAGFDFTRVCMNGTLNCAGAANTGSSPAATDWACTKDNVTKLIWSLQNGLGDWTTYAQITLPIASNAASRCGFASGWRLPTRRELLGIVHNGLATQPMIDANYFPGTFSNGYWTSDTDALDPSNAWVVYFSDGSSSAYVKTYGYYVGLVRSGP